MKRLICISFMALSCCLTTNVLAQVKLDDIRCAGVAGYTCNVIMPSMHNLIKLVNCNTDHFKATMKQYGYSPKDDYYGTDYCYDNWSVDLWMHGNIPSSGVSPVRPGLSALSPGIPSPAQSTATTNGSTRPRQLPSPPAKAGPPHCP